MAYETGTASSQQDLLTKLSTFAQANGWTQDELDVPNKELCLHRSTCYVQFRWDAIASTGSIGVYQSTGYTAGLTPGNHPEDSGSGLIGTGAITTQRRVAEIGDGPFTAYYFFEEDYYIHCVLEYAAGLFRHFGFGILEKVGSWTGGEYAYGHVWYQGVASARDNPLDSRHALPFDALGSTTNTDYMTTHAEALPGQAANGHWLVSWAGTTPGNDRAAQARGCSFGSLRGGPLSHAVAWLPVNPSNGYVPLTPIQLFYRRDPGLSTEKWYLLGSPKDVRVVNIRYIAPAEEIAIGAATWKFFPWVRKQWLQADTDESGYAGLAYKKIV